MPYIAQDRKDKVNSQGYTEAAGDLAYKFASLIDEHFKFNGISYQVFNDVVGALENTKFDFQERFLKPYEKSKLNDNGEVYTYLSAKLKEKK